MGTKESQGIAACTVFWLLLNSHLLDAGLHFWYVHIFGLLEPLDFDCSVSVRFGTAPVRRQWLCY